MQSIDITVGEKPFTVKYDKSKVDTEQMLAALKTAGEPAKVVN